MKEKSIHRITEFSDGLGSNGPQRSTISNPSALGRDFFQQTRLLRASSNLALNTARDGGIYSFSEQPVPESTTLTGKNLFQISNLNPFQFEAVTPCPIPAASLEPAKISFISPQQVIQTLPITTVSSGCLQTESAFNFYPYSVCICVST